MSADWTHVWGKPFTLDRSKPAHTLAASRFDGNRKARRALASAERRAIRRIKVIDVLPSAEVTGRGPKETG